MSDPRGPVAWLFPGQGSQKKGMGGEELFARFPDLVARADAILGYSIRELCLSDPEQRLGHTEFAQPALYVVNALSHEAALQSSAPPSFYAGHSLGEYNALQAAGCFDFATGLALVARRGRLMGQTRGGGMAAVLGVSADVVRDEVLPAAGATELDIANINSPGQVVVSGALDLIKKLASHVRAERRIRVTPLAVSAAFHSRHMQEAAYAFAEDLARVLMRELRTPVVSNTTGALFPPGRVAEILATQIRSSVRWWDSLMTLRHLGVAEAVQLGPGRVLYDLWEEARKVAIPVPVSVPGLGSISPSAKPVVVAPAASSPPRIERFRLGAAFCERHGVRLPYVAGSMYRGIASVEMVTRMARAGLLAFFGTGGLPLSEIERAIGTLQETLGPAAPFGMNLLASLHRPELEQATVELFLRRGVRFIEAAAFTHIPAHLVELRFRGAYIEGGRAYAPVRLLAKVSRAEIVKAFISPPKEELLIRLREAGRLSEAEIAAARRLPVSADVCIESDSGGHTDSGVALALLPAMVRLRDQMMSEHTLDEIPRIGAAGGLGVPEAIAAAFILGAEFVVTGSINQCTPEASTSSAVKDLLAELEVHDTTYAPAGDMFEIGARVQVARRGTLFPARANQLFQIYRSHDGLDALPEKTVATVERFLGKSIDEVWRLSRERLADRPEELARVERNEKARMARVFKWYFWRSIRSALSGDMSDRVNFQIHCGPAMGAFNAFARGSALEDWRARHVDVLAEELMGRAEHLLAIRR